MLRGREVDNLRRREEVHPCPPRPDTLLWMRNLGNSGLVCLSSRQGQAGDTETSAGMGQGFTKAGWGKLLDPGRPSGLLVQVQEGL